MAAEEVIDGTSCVFCLSSDNSSCSLTVGSLYKIMSIANEVPSSNFAIVNNQDEERACALCGACFAILEVAQDIQRQILQLQSELKVTVNGMRGKILETEGKLGEDEWLSVRQKILNCSGLQVKIERDEFEPFFKEEECSLSALQLHSDSDESGESNFPLFIDPDPDPDPAEERILRRSSRTSTVASTSVSSSSTKKRARPRKQLEAKKMPKVNYNSDPDYSSADEDLDTSGLLVEKEGSYSCVICSENFTNRKERNYHENNWHIGTEKFNCALCKKKFNRRGKLQKHLFMKHETNEKCFHCNKCNRGFTLQINWDRHREDHELEDTHPFLCDTCDRRFQSSDTYNRHLETHNNALICSYCQQAYTSKWGLARHIRIHTGEKPYTCDNCDESFIDYRSKKCHVAKAHPIPGSKHECPLCGKCFASVLHLKPHIARHEGKIAVTCGKCGEKFADRSSLNTHNIQKHDGEPLICDECGSKFMTSKGLKHHKMSHAGEKPYECEVCKKRFLTKWQLENHTRTHTGERPFVCENCGKAFKTKKHLTRHVRHIHSKDYVVPTPFKCPNCDKLFPNRYMMDGHIRQVHTGERPFVCETCNKGFAWKTTLRLHLKSHGITVAKSNRLPRSKRDKF